MALPGKHRAGATREFKRAALEFIVHYHEERNHQGLDNKLIDPNPDVGRADGEIECHEVRDFSLLPVITPDIEDHLEAAELRNRCRRKGVQVGTIDALIARLCIRHELSLLTADRDFKMMSRYCPLDILDV